MVKPMWTVEVRQGGAPETDPAQARRVVEILNLHAEDRTEAALRFEIADASEGLYRVELPSRYDEDLARMDEWATLQPIESGDTYEVWLWMGEQQPHYDRADPTARRAAEAVKDALNKAGFVVMEVRGPGGPVFLGARDLDGTDLSITVERTE